MNRGLPGYTPPCPAGYVDEKTARRGRENTTMKWKSVPIRTPGGEVAGIAPEILSASRSTDIPAFYAEWFARRLRAGYSKWINPFNGRAQYVSFENARAVVFWSKNPEPLLPYLPLLDQRGIGYYFQFTLNDYEEEGLEPGVPPLASRIETYKGLADRIGPDRVVWRFDPLILTGSTGPDRLLDKIRKVGDLLSGSASRLVFSFADVRKYRKVENNLRRRNIAYREFTPDDMRRMGSGIADLCSGWEIPARTCGETVDLSGFGIEHNRCIDPELILKITGNHPDILRLFGLHRPVQASLLAEPAGPKSVEDAGQRKACGCAPSKDIGQYDTCPHGCAYCYANTSDRIVAQNVRAFAPDGEIIAGGGRPPAPDGGKSAG
jgi:SAM-dependent methyltransferase